MEYDPALDSPAAPPALPPAIHAAHALAAQLPRSPLPALASASVRLAAGAGAACTRANLRLCFLSREDLLRLEPVECALTGAGSLLQGCIVRARLTPSARDWLCVVESTSSFSVRGGSRLRLNLRCGSVLMKGRGVDDGISPGSPLDAAAWSGGGGREECQALAAWLQHAGWPRDSSTWLFTRRDVASACWRLSLGWMWAEALPALRAVLQQGGRAAIVLMLHHDEAAIQHLMCCVEGIDEAPPPLPPPFVGASAPRIVVAGAAPPPEPPAPAAVAAPESVERDGGRQGDDARKMAALEARVLEQYGLPINRGPFVLSTKLTPKGLDLMTRATLELVRKARAKKWHPVGLADLGQVLKLQGGG